MEDANVGIEKGIFLPLKNCEEISKQIKFTENGDTFQPQRSFCQFIKSSMFIKIMTGALDSQEYLFTICLPSFISHITIIFHIGTLILH